MSDTESDSYSFVIEAEQAGQRADKTIAALCSDLSRTRLQALIAEGSVLLNHKILENASVKLAAGDIVVVDVPPVLPADPQPENIPIDIVFQDDDLLVINKQAGLVVHPGAGNQTGTLVNALLYHCGDSLSGIGGVARPGIVHRLDKDTSGLMLVAKNDSAHRHLSAQLSDRSLSRVYQAVVLKVPAPPRGKVDAPIGRHASNRLKMAANSKGARDALTHYQVKKNFYDSLALVECTLSTGRTHQIRVHMSYIGHPLVGDPLYGPQETALRAALKKGGYDEKTSQEVLKFGRQALHAGSISFIHPATGEAMSFAVNPPTDFIKLLKSLNN
jgi:23S rRNA pseudouridine1911/1915/1917 synthase